MKLNQAYLYKNSEDYYAIYVNLHELPQMIFYWNERQQCQKKPPIWRENRNQIPDCSIELFTHHGIRLNIKGLTAEFWWDLNYQPKTKGDPNMMGDIHDVSGIWTITPQVYRPHQDHSPTSNPGCSTGYYSGYYSESQPYEEETDPSTD